MSETAVFIIHTRQSPVQTHLYAETQAVCAEVGIRVWDYHDFEFHAGRLVGHSRTGIGPDLDPVRAAMKLLSFRETREEPDRRDLLRLWSKTKVIIVLEEAGERTPGVAFELDALERGYLAEMKWAGVVAAVTIGESTRESTGLGAGVPPALRLTWPRTIRTPEARAEFIALCLQCWAIRHLQESVAGAFVLARAAEASDSIAQLARSSPGFRDWDYAALAARNKSLQEEIQRRAPSGRASVARKLASLTVVAEWEGLPAVLRKVVEWFESHRFDGPLGQTGRALAEQIRRHHGEASRRFLFCTPDWMPEMFR